MPCPFCRAVNPPNARTCRVCGGPLIVAKPASIAAVPAPKLTVAPAPIASAPLLLNRLNLDEQSPPIAGIGACVSDVPMLGMFLQNGDLQRWDVAADELTHSSNRRWFRGPKRLSCAGFAPGHGLMASGYEDGEVRWFEFDGRELPSPPSHVGRVLALAWTPERFYSAGSDGVICASSLPHQGKQKSHIALEGLGAMTTMTMAPDGALLAIGRDDGAVQGWRFGDETAPRLDWSRRGHRAPIRSLGFSPGGAMLVSRGAGDELCLWAAQTSYQLPLAPRCRRSLVAPVFSVDNRWLGIISENNGVEIYDVARETLVYQLEPLGEKVRHLAVISVEEAQWLIVAGEREVAVWEIP